MRITIAQRIQPFSHTPGTRCLIPGTIYSVQVFPALVRVFSEEQQIQEFLLGIQGPVNDFTVQLDLEKGAVLVWGKAANGFFRYRIKADAGMIRLESEKGEMLSDFSMKYEGPFTEPAFKERISFGSHKKQDWDLVRRRQDLKEVFPVWYALGQVTPSAGFGENRSASLFDEIDGTEKIGKEQSYLNLFYAGFEGVLCPRGEDRDHLGFELSPVGGGLSATPLLSEGWKRIRQMFVSVSDGTLCVLPELLPLFHSGRMIGIQLEGIGELDIEWSKKQIRRMQLRSEMEGELHLAFQKQLKSYRIESERMKERVSVGEPLEVQKGVLYEFDQFQK